MEAKLDKFDLAARVVSGGDGMAEVIFRRVAQSARRSEELQRLTEEELERRYLRLCHQLASIKPRGDLSRFWVSEEGEKGLTEMERKLGIR